MNKKEIKIGSICCGMGGFDKGLHNLGMFNTVWAIDIMKEACESFKSNFPSANVVNEDAHKINDFTSLGDIDGLIFGVPCQGYSIANTNRSSSDERNYVYLATIRAIKQTHCKFFIFENVRGLMSLMYDKNTTFFERIKSDYEALGYNLTHKVVDCANVGVPQVNRHRVIIVGIRADIDFKYEFLEEEYGVNKTPYVTLKDTIFHLKDIDQKGDYDTSGYSPMYLGRNRQKLWVTKLLQQI